MWLIALFSLAIHLPAPTGTFAVGRVTLPPQIDVSREESFTPEAGDRRQVVLHVWYPARKSSAPLAPYVEGLGTGEIFKRSYRFVGLEKLREVGPHARAGAPVAEGRFPVVLFSHGLGSISFLYSSLHEELASHGYIVVGVEHPYFSSAMQLPGGRIVKNESRRPWFEGDPTPEQRATLLRIREEEAIVQADDLRFALTALGSTPFAKHARTAGVFGHSRGGFAAAHACREDSRFKACLNLDGYVLTRAVMERGLDQPYMHIEEEEASTADEIRDLRSTFGRMRGGMYHVSVAGAAHASFSDQPLIAPDKYPQIKIAPERALEITRAYVVAFFDRHLKKKAAPILDGPAPRFPEALLIIYR